MQTICQSEALYAFCDGKPVRDLSQVRDGPGEEFANSVTASLGQLGGRISPMNRLRARFDLVALAQGVKELSLEPRVRYWLKDHDVTVTLTRDTVSVHAGIAIVAPPGQTIRIVQVSGGIELNPTVLRLTSGDVTVLRDLVLASRPEDPHVLYWPVPLEGWPLAGVAASMTMSEARNNPHSNHHGCVVDVTLYEYRVKGGNTETQLVEGFYDSQRSGVTVDPQPTIVGKGRVDFWEKVLSTRPSDTSWFWDVDIKIPEE